MKFYLNLVPILVALLLTVGLPQAAHADLLISPTRAVMTDADRSVNLVLRNTGAGPRTYRLRWVEQLMDENGRYRNVETAQNPRSIAEMVRFSPRQITVGSNENQTVRLSYRPPAGIESGEYRSHLLFEILPDVSEPTSTFEMDSGMEGIGVQLSMMMSFSIPISVRHQVATPPKVSFSRVEVLPADAEQPMRLGLTLEREGNSGSFGNVVVEYQVDQASPVTLVGRQGSVAIFEEMPRRHLTIPLRQAVPPGAWVRVAYEGQEEFAGRVWDERVFRTR
ncbi:MAG: hypothetical protein LAT63_15385 [Marinobacter sp.]|nr:hypothetical protein [Marinobacter sp.]